MWIKSILIYNININKYKFYNIKYINIFKAPCLFTPFFAMQREKKRLWRWIKKCVWVRKQSTKLIHSCGKVLDRSANPRFSGWVISQGRGGMDVESHYRCQPTGSDREGRHHTGTEPHRAPNLPARKAQLVWSLTGYPNPSTPPSIRDPSEGKYSPWLLPLALRWMESEGLSVSVLVCVWRGVTIQLFR